MFSRRLLRPALFACLLALAALLAFSFVRPSTPAAPGGAISLQRPSFVDVAHAETDGTNSIASFLDDEAGISAYFQAPFTINLNDVRDLFRTIETETPEYIIGSIAVQDYPESEDVHVYIHVNGWVLAYYLKVDPAGKIFDWRGYTNNGTIPTKLDKTLAVVGAQIGASSANASYYDFRWPNATNMMLIAEANYGGGSESFEVNVPASFSYYERSWSLGVISSGYSGSIWLDGVMLYGYTPYGDWATFQGTLTATQLSPGVFHTIRVDGSNAFGGLALVYRVP